jgi:transposase
MHIKGQSRHQGTLFPERLDELIGADNPVRVIDAFVDHLDLRALGFGKAQSQATGRPPYDPADLLKLYLYGYLHRIRSSRLLERECQKNIEVLWLLNRLAPDHKTICDFRRFNAKALVRVCREFVLFCRSQSLYGGEMVAIDGSKFKADNHPVKITRKKELKRQVERIDREIEAWLEGMAEADVSEETPEPVDPERTRRALQALQAERENLTKRIAAMDERGREAEPHTDREAGSMKGGVGYNVQTAVDDKHALIVDYEVVADGNDLKQLYRMARRSRTVLQAGILKALADGGYSNGHLLARCQAHGIEPYVPVQRAVNNQGDGKYFDKSAFRYHAEVDCYECPAGEQLKRKGKARRDRLITYTTDACPKCPLKLQCTGGKRRLVTRHFEEDVLNEVAERTAANPMMMRRRKALAEHPFGTLKRRMDGGRFLVRGLQKVKAEMALAVTAYNLTRAINVLGVRRLCQVMAT